MNKAIVIAAAVCAVALAGCETTKQIETVAVAAEKAKPPMPAACRSDTHDKFKQVAKAKTKDTTEMAALGHALQSNKSRMSKNLDRTIECECAIAKESGNPDDIKRLEGKCPGEAALPAEGKKGAAPAAPTPPAAPKPKAPKLPEVT